VRRTTNPTIVAIATPARNAAEIFTGLEVVRKMIADMICGPAIIVMASGRMSRFMGSHDATRRSPPHSWSLLVNFREHPFF
jgi:hypothetical protein